jgi:hypothetical protein
MYCRKNIYTKLQMLLLFQYSLLSVCFLICNLIYISTPLHSCAIRWQICTVQLCSICAMSPEDIVILEVMNKFFNMCIFLGRQEVHSWHFFQPFYSLHLLPRQMRHLSLLFCFPTIPNRLAMVQAPWMNPR